jgi:hypothetical protein
MRTRTKLITALTAAIGLTLVATVPANAAYFSLTAKTCGASTARYVYINTTAAAGIVTHVHINGGTSTSFTYNDAALTPRFSTARYTKETAPALNTDAWAVVKAYGTSCDN